MSAILLRLLRGISSVDKSLLYLAVPVILGILLTAVMSTRPQWGETSSIAASKDQDSPQYRCVVAAFSDYSKANIARLSQPPAQLLSIETEIAGRRLREQYCLRYAGCLATNTTDQAGMLQHSAVFSTCLSEEEHEDK
jgi:hypothetical protein